jgi:hypothetical protein
MEKVHILKSRDNTYCGCPITSITTLDLNEYKDPLELRQDLCMRCFSFYKKRIEKKKEVEVCKGLVFRGYTSTWTSYVQGKIETKQGVRLLKKKSCPGCNQCSWLLDAVDDIIYSDGLIMPTIEHGALYSIIVVNESRDFESGICDGFDLEIIKID